MAILKAGNNIGEWSSMNYMFAQRSSVGAVAGWPQSNILVINFIYKKYDKV